VLLASLHFPLTSTAFTHEFPPSTPFTSTHCVHVPSKQLNFPFKPSVHDESVEQLEQLAAVVLPSAEYGVAAGHTVGVPAPSVQ
jgi:hypothetical protein